MGTKTGSRWTVALVLWLALLYCPTMAIAQQQAGDSTTHLSSAEESEKTMDGTEQITGPVLALAALLLTSLALVAWPRRRRSDWPTSRTPCPR